MSGQQIGTVIGGVIGAYFGNPQLGMAIGGFIGGAIDPDKINGPHIGDGQQQMSSDGAPIAWINGTAKVAGTIIQASERREVKVKDSGKGSPVVSHYEQRQDFAILVCESSQLRNSSVRQIVMVEQDGKIVYDVRNGAHADADPTTLAKAIMGYAKWANNVDFLYGDEDQLPHPTLEAITGVGNTPSYRGSCIAVFKDFNITAAGGRIPQFTFTVTEGATSHVEDNVLTDYDAVSTGNVCEKDQDNVHGWSEITPLPSEAIGIYQITALTPWAATKTTVGTMEVSPGYGLTCIPTSIAVEWLNEVGDFDSGWVASNPAALTAATAWFASKGLPLPQQSTLPTWPLDVSGPSWFINAFKVTQLRYAGGFDDVPNEVEFKFALTGGKNLAPLGGGYYVDQDDGKIWRPSWIPPLAGNTTYTSSSIALSDLVTKICVRGGLTESDIDVTDITGITVAGYPVARSCNAVDCLTPLLQTYFCYASEYDGQIHFKRYGADAAITVLDDDLLEANDANDNNVTSDTRSQATEFPRKITASYTDPAQNYMVVTVAAERLAVDVTAIGEQAFPIPVVMDADQAKQAVDKALKVAYATLEGKQEYSVPFAGKGGAYLSLCAGEPLLFRGKRWIADEAILGNGYLKLTTRYDRQSAYTSTVQAITGNAPGIQPLPYSGPTTLIAMNIPSLRPQDTYGLYLVANAAYGTEGWRGCTVQISYDNKVTWQNALDITQGGTFGIIVENEPTGGEPLTVLVNDDLETITDEQVAAHGNGFAITRANVTEVGQFKTATEDVTTDNKYELTDVMRGLNGTNRKPCVAGDTFAMLDSAYFLPISLDFSGRTIYLRAVGFGEAAEDAKIISIVYTATFIVPQLTYNRIDSDGDFRVDSDGNQRVST